MKKSFALLLLVGLVIRSFAQQPISLMNGWVFHNGDSSQWASVSYNDNAWKPINLSMPWEQQGYPDYDGYGWYRLHLFIPASLRDSAYLKDNLRITLNSVDDNDEVYLNGKLIAKHGGRGGSIEQGNYGPRSYTVPANDPAILWGKQNVMAVRIFDTGGNGGMYGDKFTLSMDDITDAVTISNSNDFDFGDNNSLSKTVKVLATGHYLYKGKLDFTVTDPETNAVIYQKTNDAAFSAGKPFTYSFNVARLYKRSYLLKYTFTDEKSGKVISKTEATPYILTPYPTAKPKINGPDMYGARPGNPFLYLIPATGRKPLIYEATGLPEGLKLDAATGVISGMAAQKGDYKVIFTVHNSLGSKSKQFTIRIGDVIGLTPALGWNSWNAWGLTVNDKKVKVAAKTMISKLSSHGWNYINIDDGWEAEHRAPDSSIVTNQKFPDMKALTSYVHSLGLKMGIYSSPGPRTCGNFLGSWKNEESDARTYGDWGIDYLKYDWCSYSLVTAKNPTLEDFKKPYQVMRSALNKVPRDIMFSFCQYGMGDVWKWGAQVGGNSWRTTGDIEDTWKSMSGIGFNQIADGPYAQPGHFNDPDMLVVGKVGWGDNQHNSRLTPDEQYTHISLWSLLASPLLIGCDMGQLDEFTLNLLTNDEVLAIDQDELGKEAAPVIQTGEYQVWAKDLKDGGKAVGIFNTTDKYQTIILNRNENGFNAYTKLRDVWQQKYIITTGTNFTAKVAPHGVFLVKMSK